jgi:class 3 adenylate cyclase
VASHQKKTVAVLISDAVNYSRQMHTNEEETIARITEDLQRLTETVTQYEGQVVKNTGDGILATFPTIKDAVQAAFSFQKNREPNNPLKHRIGIHWGNVYENNRHDILGDAVNVAARLQTECTPNRVCMSKTVYLNAKAQMQLPFALATDRYLKNVGPVSFYTVDPLDPVSPEPMSEAEKLALRKLNEQREYTFDIIGTLANALQTLKSSWALLAILVIVSLAASNREELNQPLNDAKALLARLKMTQIAKTGHAMALSGLNNRQIFTNLNREFGVPPPKDPWGNNYYVQINNQQLVLTSPGPDKLLDTPDDIIVAMPIER